MNLQSDKISKNSSPEIAQQFLDSHAEVADAAYVPYDYILKVWSSNHSFSCLFVCLFAVLSEEWFSIIGAGAARHACAQHASGFSRLVHESTRV